MKMPVKISYLAYQGEKIAYHQQQGQSIKPEPTKPGLVFLGGFRSDMMGSKAQALADYADGAKLNYLRFDYFGHGQSSGDFLHGTMSHWRQEVLHVLNTLTKGSLILVGSSFGGWLSTLMATQLKDRIKGLVLIAPAIDMTERLMWQTFDEDMRAQLMQDGIIYTPSDYDAQGYPVTRDLIEDGRGHLILDQKIEFDGRVRILHGQQDKSVPWQLSLEIAEKITSTDIDIHYVKNGDHSLSTPENLTLLCRTVDALYKSLS